MKASLAEFIAAWKVARIDSRLAISEVRSIDEAATVVEVVEVPSEPAVAKAVEVPQAITSSEVAKAKAIFLLTAVVLEVLSVT